jgi:hypothetical protein
MIPLVQKALARFGGKLRFAARMLFGALLANASAMQENAAKNHDGIELASLTQLRDEIRVRVHLAQLDAKDTWQKLEEQIVSLEHRVASDGGTVLGATAQLAKELKQSLVDFRERLSA